MKDASKLFGKKSRLVCAIVIAALIGFSMAGCDILGDLKDNSKPTGNTFVAVTSIGGIEDTVVVGKYTLNGTVTPSSATNKTIVWSVYDKGETEATISGNVLDTKKTGTVTVKATITNGTATGTNFTKTFSIDVVPIIPVESITEVPKNLAGGTQTLNPTVLPSNASKKNIVWKVTDKGTTEAEVSGNLVDTTAAGTFKLKATIAGGKAVDEDYTEEFTITVAAITAFKAVTDITDVPTRGSIGVELQLTGKAAPSNATHGLITWSLVSPGTTGATISDNTLKAAADGVLTVRATVRKGASTSDDFTKDFPVLIGNHVPVTGITDNFTTDLSAGNTQLKGTVSPNNASFKDIDWTVKEKTPGITEAKIEGETLTAKGSGTVTVLATVKNGKALGTPFTKEFPVVIGTHVPVTDITLNYTTDLGTGIIQLMGTVSPNDASFKKIDWTVKTKTTTTAVIEGNTLTTTGSGTVTVTATIANGKAMGTPFTSDFDITASTPVMGDLEITIIRADSTSTAFKFSVKPVPGAASYKVLTPKATEADSFTETTLQTTNLSENEIDELRKKLGNFYAYAVDKDGELVSYQTTLPGMVKYADETKHKDAAIDWMFNFVDTGLQALSVMNDEAYFYHVDTRNNIYAIRYAEEGISEEDGERYLYKDGDMYEDLSNATATILKHYGDIINCLIKYEQRELLDAMDEALIRLWFNQVTDSNNDAVLSRMIVPSIKNSYPAVKEIK
jgi:hypothetical protein